MNKSFLEYQSLLNIDGVYYDKISKKVFSGKVKGSIKGVIVNGLKEKIWKSFHKNGNLFWVGYFQNGMKQSFFHTYYDNGQLLKVISYKDDLPHGEWCTYWKNGNMWIRGFYDFGVEKDEWEYYNRDGTLNKKEKKIFINPDKNKQKQIIN